MTLHARANATLLGELRQLIEQARQHVAHSANSSLTMLYWRVGYRIGVKLLNEKRAPNGEEIVSVVSTELTRANGSGFSASALTRMVEYAEFFPEQRIVATLSQELSWSHFVETLPLKQPLERELLRKCAASSAGVLAPGANVSTANYTGARPSPKSRKTSCGRKSATSARVVR